MGARRRRSRRARTEQAVSRCRGRRRPVAARLARGWGTEQRHTVLGGCAVRAGRPPARACVLATLGRSAAVPRTVVRRRVLHGLVMRARRLPHACHTEQRKVTVGPATEGRRVLHGLVVCARCGLPGTHKPVRRSRFGAGRGLTRERGRVRRSEQRHPADLGRRAVNTRRGRAVRRGARLGACGGGLGRATLRLAGHRRLLRGALLGQLAEHRGLLRRARLRGLTYTPNTAVGSGAPACAD